MNRLVATWQEMDPRRRFVVGLAALAALIAVIGLGRMAASPSMALLYSGLDPSAAGGVVSALDGRGAVYEVRGDAIYVASDQRDRLRMELASEGRPAGGPAGYELLDGISGFGTTSEMFDATYWRAKEGELARTILALPGVRSARVHIANPVRKPFERKLEPSAAVTVAMRSGALGETQAMAIRHLVGSAVAGLDPANVTVLDADGGVVLKAGEDSPAANARTAADARAAALKANVERLLAARVGEGAAVVEVSVDADMDSEKITERTLDPDSRVAIHTDSEETTEQESGSPASVTVASNLPAGDASGGGESRSASSTTRERANYEVSEVLRERVRHPGEIRRISVAVLVDGVRTPGPDGAEVWAPRPEEEIDALRELVQTAIGFDAARGDVVSIETMEFSQPPERGTLARTDAYDFLAANAMTLVQLGVLSAVALALGLLVLRPMLTARRPQELDDFARLEDAAEGGEAVRADAMDVAGSVAAAGEVIDAEGLPMDRLKALRDAVADRPEDAMLLLRSWLDLSEPEKGQA